MNLFKQIFGKGEPPVEHWEHEVLGKLTWDDEYEAWRGRVENLDVLLAYERNSSVPPSSVVDLACAVLGNRGDFDSEVARLKERAISIYEQSFHAEISALVVRQVFFIDGERALVAFDGGADFRAWRIAIEGDTYHDLSFDA